MPLSTSAGNSLALLLFNNTAWTNFGDAGGLRATVSAGSLFIALHTADPGVGGDQTTSEAAYGSYARQAVARSAAGFTVSGKTVTLVSNVTFPARTSGEETELYASIGTLTSGAGVILAVGLLSPSVTVSASVTTPIVLAAGTSFVIS